MLPGKESAIPIPESAQKSWTPEEPWLYPYSLEYGEDRVLGYFALRKCNVQTAADGYPRFFLNDQPYFQNGVLDQGYWPDGLYTAPSDEALIHDICAMKTLASICFANMARSRLTAGISTATVWECWYGRICQRRL